MIKAEERQPVSEQEEGVDDALRYGRLVHRHLSLVAHGDGHKHAIEPVAVRVEHVDIGADLADELVAARARAGSRDSGRTT